ncbi:MAG: hypothetical protein SPJ29_07725 [Phocaeicola sp.]|nr:hypothetical protein [Phocaeicola sp.]MDD7448568.1 hypothetical protein [Prevotellaceae bacterium]MDY5939610.1 hypothetical protein [Phocaeicola sp.]
MEKKIYKKLLKASKQAISYNYRDYNLSGVTKPTVVKEKHQCKQIIDISGCQEEQYSPDFQSWQNLLE